MVRCRGPGALEPARAQMEANGARVDEKPAARTSAARTPATRTPTARRPPHLDAPVYQLHGADADPARADSVVVHAHAANDPRGILL